MAATKRTHTMHEVIRREIAVSGAKQGRVNGMLIVTFVASARPRLPTHRRMGTG